MSKIKNFIKQCLFKDELLQINDLTQKQNRLQSMILHNEDLIKSFLATCQTGYDLGVSKYYKNWCVFVKQSKSKNGQDFVKFIDLSDMDLKDIVNFEKQLEYLNKNRNKYYKHIDAPVGIKDFFIFK